MWIVNADGEIVSKEVGEEERPDALVRAEARAPALLALAPDALVRADARPPAPLALNPAPLGLADARAPALLAFAPLALVRTNARAPALLAIAPSALVLADARAPAPHRHVDLGKVGCPLMTLSLRGFRIRHVCLSLDDLARAACRGWRRKSKYMC